MADAKTEHKIDLYNRFGTPWQWLSALAVGLVSGGWTFLSVVKVKFLADGEFKKGFEIINDYKEGKLAEINNDYIDKQLKLAEPTLGEHPSFKRLDKARGQIKTLAGKLRTHEINEEYSLALKEFFETCHDELEPLRKTKAFQVNLRDYITEVHGAKVASRDLQGKFARYILGFSDGEFKGTWQRFKQFGRSQRTLGLKSLAAVGAGFGVTLMAWNQLNTRDKLNEADKTTGDTGRKLDAIIEHLGMEQPKNTIEYIERQNGKKPHMSRREQLVAREDSKADALMAERQSAEQAETEHAR